MEKIRIQDDLYTYVNQAKLDELVIPDDMPVAGGFAALSDDVEKLMHQLSECNTKLTAILETQTKDIEDHEARLAAIEKKPGTYWDKVVAAIIGAAASALWAMIRNGG